jgi:hypothetical protein
MALVVKDRVRETSTTTGTGTVTLGGAYDGYQTFASAVADGSTVFYCIHNTATAYDTEWEVGLGTFTASGTTISRDTIYSSSNSGSAVNFSAGTKEVFLTYPAEKAVYEDATGNVTVPGKITVGAEPTADSDVATKLYVDNLVATGIDVHDPVRVESPTALSPVTYNNGTAGVGATLTNAGTQVALVIDGVTVNTNDRVLIYTQTDATQNGIYVVTDTGSGSTNWVLTRATDADSNGTLGPDTLSQGTYVYVQEGNTGAGESYVCSTVGTITFGTTEITFSQFSAVPTFTGGTNIDVTAQTISLTGVVDETNGGTGNSSYVTGDTLYASGTNTLGKLSGNTTTTKKFLSQTGTGSASQAPAWEQPAFTDVTGTVGSGQLSGSYTGITGVGTLAAGTWNANLIGIAYGGTGQSTATAAFDALAPDQTGNSGKYLTTNGSTTSWAALSVGDGTLTMATSGTGLSGSATFTANDTDNVSFTVTSNATDANTAGAIVARDGSGNFSAGTITASLSGNASTATTATNASNVATADDTTTNATYYPTFVTASSSNNPIKVSSTKLTYNPSTGTLSSTTFSGALSGNATTATTLQTARNIQGVSFNGSADITVVTGGTGVSVAGTAVSIGQAVGTGSNVQFNSLGVGTAASGTAGEIRATNNVTAYYSDDRLKTKLGSIENALDKLCSLSGFYYEANETAQALGYEAVKEVGVSAQEVQKVLPEVVVPAPIDENYLTVRYERVLPLVIEAIKELRAEVKALKGE